MLEIGSLVEGKYKILNEVGHGGMSVVYLAMNEKANKQWAVKEVRKDGVKDFEVVKQGLVAEIDILKRLNHPSLPSIVDVLDGEESFIIVMDYIQGNSLQKALQEYGAQPQNVVIEWAKQLCDVLVYLHSREPSIIYRDMKPANIMLKPDGKVTLIDFGTAREFKERNLADTHCLGTVGYAAPEQFGGRGQTDGRTDIYGLGATLYHLVTGMNPCEPPYEIRPIRQINPALSGGLEKIILKCTQNNPDDRYQSAAELMYALEHYEEIDDLYKKKQKKKLTKFIASTAATAVFGATAIWANSAAEATKTQNYELMVQQADRWPAYAEAIAIDPTRTEAYLGFENHEKYDNIGLIAYFLEDQNLDSQESVYLRQIKLGTISINGTGNVNTQATEILDKLKTANPEGYKEVCNRIGQAFLFYLKADDNIEKARFSNAVEWFSKVNDKDNYPLAHACCGIGDCLNDVENYKNSKDYDELEQSYKQLYNKLSELAYSVNTYGKTNVSMIIWEQVVSMLNEDGSISVFYSNNKEKLPQLLSDIKEKCETSTKDNPLYDERRAKLIEKIEDLEKRIMSIKSDNTSQ